LHSTFSILTTIPLSFVSGPRPIGRPGPLVLLTTHAVNYLVSPLPYTLTLCVCIGIFLLDVVGSMLLCVPTGTDGSAPGRAAGSHGVLRYRDAGMQMQGTVSQMSLFPPF